MNNIYKFVFEHAERGLVRMIILDSYDGENFVIADITVDSPEGLVEFAINFLDSLLWPRDEVRLSEDEDHHFSQEFYEDNRDFVSNVIKSLAELYL